MTDSIRKRVLDNGLTVISETIPHVRSVTVGVWLRRGSRNEPKPVNGISHFIEHLVFKGTETRSARDIALAMDSVGGQMDAFTAKEYTCFYARVLDTHLPETIDLLADIVQRPLFDPVELERERKVVLEEIRMVDDTPDDLIYDLFAEHVYPGHPLGRPIQGTEDTVGALSRRRLLGYFRDAYRPENLLVVAAGNIDHRGFLRQVRRAFGDLESPGKPPRGVSRPREKGGFVTRSKPELGQLHLLAGVPAFVEALEERYALFVLNALLGGTMSSRLFQRIREERGLAYSVYSAVNLFADCGTLNVYAGTSPDRGREVYDLVVGELVSLRDEGPTGEELAVAKENLKGSLMLALESTSSRMSNVARQEIHYGRNIGLEETLRGIDAVDVDAIQGMARRLFTDATLSVAAVGRTGRFRLGREALRL